MPIPYVRRVCILALLSALECFAAKPQLADFEEIPTRPTKRFAIDILPTGILFAKVSPGRLAMAQVNVAGPLSAHVDMLGSLGTTEGWGLGFGLLMGDPMHPFEGSRFGARYDFISVEGTTAFHEIYGHYIYQWSIDPRWKWHMGGSMGLGVSEFEVVTYRDSWTGETEDVLEADMGFTFRFELGLGYVLF